MADSAPPSPPRREGPPGRGLRLPEDVQRLLTDSLGALSTALAERIKEMCDAAHANGYESGWHDGWAAGADAARADSQD